MRIIGVCRYLLYVHSRAKCPFTQSIEEKLGFVFNGNDAVALVAVETLLQGGEHGLVARVVGLRGIGGGHRAGHAGFANLGAERWGT